MKKDGAMEVVMSQQLEELQEKIEYHFTDEKLDAMLAEKWHDSDPTKAIRKEFPKS